MMKEYNSLSDLCTALTTAGTNCVGVYNDIVGSIKDDNALFSLNGTIYSGKYGSGTDFIDEVGIAIQDVNGAYYTTTEMWKLFGSPTVNGIAISDGTHRFCIGLNLIKGVSGESPYCRWGGYNKTSGLTNYTSSATAITDFNGSTNTNTICANITSSDGYFTVSPYSAAALCKQYTFPNGKSGYLLSAGELLLCVNNKTSIKQLLSDLNAESLTAFNYLIWSSTQCSSYFAWRYGFSYSLWGYNFKYYIGYVVPVAAL